jgi:hypothetical protein
MPMNMSYCRFRNTLIALRECEESFSDTMNNPLDELSEDEKKAAKSLIKLCRRFADDNEDFV